MIGSEGLAENYPRQGVVGQPLQVMIGITNREGVEADYLVRAYQDDQIIGQAGSFHLVNGQNIEAPLTIYPVADGEDVQVNLHLFRDSKPEVYRSLLLWLDVEPAP